MANAAVRDSRNHFIYDICRVGHRIDQMTIMGFSFAANESKEFSSGDYTKLSIGLRCLIRASQIRCLTYLINMR